ncbi:MAG: hypothetical protein IT269_09335 [Saprospiraceae bacterium]|nr:hypothetical protein [Saprospiraceae bacterium]
MKKTVITLFAGALLAFSLASCGEKLLTPEQVQAEIAKGVEAGKPAIQQEMDAKCTSEMEARVEAEYQRMVEDHNAMKEQEAATAPTK